MSKTSPTHTLNPVKTRFFSYPEQLAFGLLQFARSNRDFHEYLTAKIGYIRTADDNPAGKSTVPPELFLPPDIQTAIQRTEWLFTMMRFDHTPAYRRAISALASGIQSRELASPKQIVIGFVGVAVPGPTLGIIKRKKRMNIYINENIRDQAAVTITAAQASHQVVLKALTEAGGHIGNLEPDLSDWLFGEKAMKINSISENKFSIIKDMLRGIKAPLGETKYLDKPSALAVSPALNPDVLI